MYPPNQYSRLETDAESEPHLTFPIKRTKILGIPLPLIKPLSILTCLILFLTVVLKSIKSTPSTEHPRKNIYVFDHHPRPEWLDSNSTRSPLALRLAIITRVDGFERRQALRESVLVGIRHSDVQLEYRFFVGQAPDGVDGLKTKIQLMKEMQFYDDILYLKDIPDVYERLSEKRYAALKWGGSIPHATYDYFMTMDSDTFCRFGALARRLPRYLADKYINPRTDPVLIGRMGAQYSYYINNVDDDNMDASQEDKVILGPWYSYPSGIGYMISSSLMHSLISTTSPLPHHIHYPSDDLMIGAWIAALHAPKPYLPEVIKTEVVDDIVGWHDFPGRGGHDALIGWESVCIHRLSPTEMGEMRDREEIREEWQD
ncbi:galactosyltransferase-domain-containing protein [Crucibulum laeve]|uniref:Hexosyltransferase n=1 Tax=Crucibulum laeve TaxID=68775 RepID=A0A5C3M294_9AGAR|nr:galactosyltransferase-domain-containing protein [Crucibulum laeve]